MGQRSRQSRGSEFADSGDSPASFASFPGLEITLGLPNDLRGELQSSRSKLTLLILKIRGKLLRTGRI